MGMLAGLLDARSYPSSRGQKKSLTNENGELLIDSCAINELRTNNTYFPHKQQHKYTFTNTRDQKSMIDYLITNMTITPSEVIDVRALSSVDIGTDHNLLPCKMIMGNSRDQTPLDDH